MTIDQSFFAEHPVLIQGVRELHGWLGNMSPHPVGQWRTAEAAFQALRFPQGSSARDEIAAAKSPMAAKMIAKRRRGEMCIEPRSAEDVALMEQILKLKIEQHPRLLEMLLATESRLIIEDCSRRRNTSGLFWGAAGTGNPGWWRGENRLGALWMKLRTEGRT